MRKLIIILLLLTKPCFGITEEDYTAQVLVNHLRLQLIRSEAWIEWDRRFSDWYRIDELKPYTGFF